MFRAVSDARVQYDKRARALGIVTDKWPISNSLDYARLEQAVRVDIQRLPAEVFIGLDSGTKMLLGFLDGWTWALVTAGTPGISWLELCIMFFLHGGRCDYLGLADRHEGQTKHTLRTVLKSFICKFKATVKIHLVQHSQVFFKSSKVTALRCNSIGYSNHCACIVGLPALGDDQASELTKMLVGMRHTFTNNSSRLFSENLLKLPARRFSYRGAIPSSWTNASSRFPCVIPTQVQTWLQELEAPEIGNNVQLELTCPVCKCTKECSNQVLLKGTTWKVINCLHKNCRASRTSSKWICTCGRPWYLCQTHAPIGHAAGRLRKGPFTGSASLAAGTGERVSGFSGVCGGPAPQSLPARPRPPKRRWISVTHGVGPTTQIHHNIQLGSQLERVCRRRHQVDCHETLATTTGTRKRRVEPHANCISLNKKKRKSEQHDSVIAAIDRLREGALANDLGLGRS